MKKNILLLGGSYGQLPAIIEAKKLGLYTILCDYLPDNPGARMVDEFHLVSTTDKQAVLALARAKKIDFVLAYASDPATPTAAYVSEQLGLPGNSLQSIQTLSRKDLFRQLQKENGFNTPLFRVIDENQAVDKGAVDIPLPVIVKPVDSSDSKGVVKVEKWKDLETGIAGAMKFSRIKKVILEEFIDEEQANLHGDAFFLDGKMVFCMLGDSLFRSASNPLKPSTEIYPSRVSKKLVSRAENEVASIVSKSGFSNGAVNIEARINTGGEMYIMEIGPRSGGTLTPQTIFYATGFDMLQATFAYFLHGDVKVNSPDIRPAINCAMHTNRKGILKQVAIDDSLRDYIVEQHLYVKPGDEILPYSFPGSLIGVLIMRFNDFAEADAVIDTLYDKLQAAIVLE